MNHLLIMLEKLKDVVNKEQLFYVLLTDLSKTLTVSHMSFSKQNYTPVSLPLEMK